MNKVFYEKLKAAAEAGIKEGDEFIVGEAKPLAVEAAVNLSGNITKDVTFDGAGNASFGISKYCAGLTIHISGSMSGGPDNAAYNLTLTTNYPQRFDWAGIRAGQTINADIKTNFWRSTSINANLHSSVPNSKATVNLHYST